MASDFEELYGTYKYKRYLTAEVQDFNRLVTTAEEIEGAQLVIQPDKGYMWRPGTEGTTANDWIKIYDYEGYDFYVADLEQGNVRPSDEVYYKGYWYRLTERQVYDDTQPVAHTRYIACRKKPDMNA